MKTIAILLGFVAVAYAADCGNPTVDPNPNRSDFFDKIVGGTIAVKDSLPWQCHLGYKSVYGSNQFICGGTIIGSKWILTAAHCIISTSASAFTVRVGQHDSSIQEASARNYKVKRVIKHNLYNANTINNDIALIELTDAIVFTPSIQPACLPPALHDCASGSTGIASGWGETLPNGRNSIQMKYPWLEDRAVSTKLRQVKVNCVSRTTCNLADYYGGMITTGMVCAGTTGKDSCQGDSGGPFIQKNSAGKYEVIGVVSWGYGCGAVKKPGVYARVGNYINWIKGYTGSL